MKAKILSKVAGFLPDSKAFSPTVQRSRWSATLQG